MKITKYEHACLVVEEPIDSAQGKQGRRLVIDPGIYAKSLIDYQNIDAIVVTHIHPDHFDPERIAAIATVNPNLRVFTPQDVANELKQQNVIVAKAGETQQVSSFSLQFFGGQHAIIHGTYPQQQNVGVFVNKSLYYPGDSFAKPAGSVKVLAVPADAPWMKIGEAMDFLTDLKPEIVFPTHTIFLSELGEGLTDSLLSSVVQPSGGSYRSLKVGQSMDVD